MIWAIQKDELYFIKLLIEKGADVNAQVSDY
jgi:hypothetical protein